MGQIPARDTDHPAIQLLRHRRDMLPQLIMLQHRKPRKADAHNRTVRQLLPQEIQRNHRPMIQRRLIRPGRSGRQPAARTAAGKRGNELRVIVHRKTQLRRPESSHIPGSPLPIGYMDIIRIHRCMRTYDHNRIRLQRRSGPHDLPISLHRRLQLRLLAPADFRQENWRMWYHKPSQNCHHPFPLQQTSILLSV